MGSIDVAEFSLSDKDFKKNYPIYYNFLRKNSPIHWDKEENSWFITRYRDIEKYLASDDFITSPIISEKKRRLIVQKSVGAERVSELISTWMIYNDKPMHTRLRKESNKLFQPNQLFKMIPHITEIISERINQVLENHSTTRTFDFVEEIAYSVPRLVLSKIIGIPMKDFNMFINWAEDISIFMQEFIVSDNVSADLLNKTDKSVVSLSNYLNELIQQNRLNPSTNLISTLIRNNDGESENLDVKDFIAIITQLMFGGHKVPQFVIANTLHLLFANPAIFQEVKANLDLVKDVVEESMRLETPSQYLTRIAATDVVINDKLINKGDSVYFFVGAANRDDDVFKEPDKFDIYRKNKRHLSFGVGYHACVAAFFARLEVTEVIKQIIKNAPQIVAEYDVEKPDWTANPNFHSITYMPVRY
ncbi:cytochrome P450 [Priestia megaterium]|uniref:cytochrome P450 n=1 Tax=Priestia megaterium TaxID=1404 RepID=UPI0025B2804E|nr:cytochrome P450 [Priestia megaterium]MDN3233368.1 cytochrome P450 [Priestia megaterium]